LHSPLLDATQNAAIFGKCNNANGHGHNYKVTVVLYGSVDPVTGMVVNLYDVGVALRTILATVDHKNLDLDVEYFRRNGIVSTAENLAVFFWRALLQFPTLAKILYEVRIDETEKNTAWYRGEGDEATKLESIPGLKFSGASST